MTSVVRVEGLSKKYVIGHERERYRALRDVIAGLWRPRGATRELEDFWALRDINLEIREGERLGIIGRNGAGKSTLLKVLSRITEPSAGRVRILGRVASLLEVGTGFHPELTGRENIYLNGAILGMTRADIRRRFEAIVEFAEVSRFLDTPVKRYSSGMYVRLAFAVAAHLEPDILVVDEVLAVGDAIFQKKCIGKMDEAARAGRTVIFVSHSMDTVLRLCSRAILLKEGRVHREGPVEQVISDYLHAALDSRGELAWPDDSTAPGNAVARLLGLRTRAQDGGTRARFSLAEPVDIEVDYAVLAEGRQIGLALELASATDQQLVVAFDGYARGPWGTQPPHPAGRFRTAFRVPAQLLNEGEVGINLRIFSPPLPPNEDPHVRLMRGLQFILVDPMDGGGARGSFPHSWGAPALRPALETRTERLG